MWSVSHIVDRWGVAIGRRERACIAIGRASAGSHGPARAAECPAGCGGGWRVRRRRLALLFWPWRRGRRLEDGRGRPRRLFVAGGRGGAALRPGAQRMWEAARARGCARRLEGPSSMTGALGGWRVSFGGFGRGSGSDGGGGLGGVESWGSKITCVSSSVERAEVPRPRGSLSWSGVSLFAA